MIPALLAQTNAALPLSGDQGVFAEGLAFTHQMVIYIGLALAIYFVLLFAGRMIKRQLGVPLGWVYHTFCFAMALFVPSLLPYFKTFDVADKHIDALAILSGAFVAISFVRHYLFESRKGRQNVTLPKFVSQLVSILIVLVALVVVIQLVYKQPLPGLLAGAGVAGIVLGLALQDTLGNMFSGFAIYFGEQFKSGDWLLIEGNHARIEEINWRSTRLRTIDDIYLDIPNSSITRQTVINYNYPNKLHGMLLEIGLDYDTPPTQARQVLVDAALNCGRVLRSPAPNVYLKEFGSSAVNYELRFWLDDHGQYKDAYSEIRTNLWYSLRRHGISIPYPITGEFTYEPPELRKDVPDAIRAALKEVIFYPCLTATQFEWIVEGSKIIAFGEGENIIRQRAEAGPMYILINGEAEVLVESPGGTTQVARIGPGDCLGEMSVLTGESRSATVRALADCEAVEVSKDALAPVMADSPDLLESLSELLAKRRLQNEGKLAEAGDGIHVERQKNYKAGFLQKLQSFFQI